MEILAVIVVLLLLWFAATWSSARSYFAKGRLAGMEEATREIIRGVRSHFDVAGQDLPDNVAKAVEAVSSFAQCKTPEKSILRYQARLWTFGDAVGAACWRKVKVTEQRTAKDFAECMREIVDVHYPEADRIRVVLDNLSTHKAGALYQAFPPDEARRVLRRIEFHHTPKHASWLNMVEIEIGVLSQQCLDRRIDSHARLVSETAAWEKRRNAERARINWMFTTENARAKLGRAYPKVPAKPTKKQRVKTPVQRY